MDKIKVKLTQVVGQGKKVQMIATVQRGYESPVRGAKETTPPDHITTPVSNQRPWMNWGVNNMWPQEVMTDLRKSSLVKRIFNDLSDIHVGSGLLYGTYEILEDGTRIFKPAYIQEVEDFLEQNDVFEVQKQLAIDLECLFNAFPEMIWDEKHTKIVQYSAIKAPYCRIQRKDSKDRASFVYVASRWPNPTQQQYKRVGIDNGSSTGLYKFCLPLAYPTMDLGLYYSIPHWDTVRQNGWLDVAEKVPQILNTIYANESILKYQVTVPMNYFTDSYCDWNDMSADQQNDAKTSLETDLTDFLSDIDNYGKSFISYVKMNDDGTKKPGIEIAAIDNRKLSKDGFLIDAAAANSEICFATGMPVVLSGVGVPGAKSSQGSGSTIREELWKMQALMASRRDVSLKPLRLISRINKWKVGDKSIVWKYGDISTIQTLNKNPNGKEPAVTGE
jgi:hypothetical protein